MERLRPWLVTVAVNEAKKLLEKGRRRAQVEITADVTLMAGGPDPASTIDALAVMDRLDPEDRALLAMRYAIGFDATELRNTAGRGGARSTAWPSRATRRRCLSCRPPNSSLRFGPRS